MPASQKKVRDVLADALKRFYKDVTKKAVNFDLETEAVLRETGFKSTAPAYSAIRSYMEAHGFKHRQYSGYISRHPMDEEKVADILDEMAEQFPWLPACYERCGITSIFGTSFDYLSSTRKANDLSADSPTATSLGAQTATQEKKAPDTGNRVSLETDDLTPEEQSLTLDAIAEVYQSYCDAFNRENGGRCPGTNRGDAR